jgi:DDE superfamily endonuclease
MGTLRFADLQTRPMEVLDLTSLTVDEFRPLVPPFEAAFQAHMAEWHLDGQPRTARPVHPLPELSPADRGGSVAVYPGLPENLCLAGRPGTPLRDGPKQGPSVDSCPPGRLAGDAAQARGCPHPVLDGARPAYRRGRGRRGGHGHADGGVTAPGRSARIGAGSGARFPPFSHDGTERRIERPQDPAEQTRCDRGKKKCHTVKNVLLINAALRILFLSETYGGRVHEKRIADTTPYPLPAGSRWLQDLGFLAFTLDQVEVIMPTKKPRGRALRRAQKAANRRMARRRVRIEHVNSSIKRCRIVHDTSRLRKAGLRDRVMEVCCALHNFRVRLWPWQPMI